MSFSAVSPPPSPPIFPVSSQSPLLSLLSATKVYRREYPPPELVSSFFSSLIPTFLDRIIKRGAYCVPFFEKTDINKRIVGFEREVTFSQEEISLALYPRGILLLKKINGCKSSVEFANRMAEFDRFLLILLLFK